MTTESLPVPPPVYGRWAPMAPVSMYSRFFALTMAIGGLALLVTAATLTPSPTGVGTHRRLGMAKCGFLDATGYPCPACGMTTSFAWFVRGNWIASGYVQPMGFLLAVASGLTFWFGLWTAVTGQSVRRMIAIIPDGYYLFPLLAIALLAWGWKIWSYRHGYGGWV